MKVRDAIVKASRVLGTAAGLILAAGCAAWAGGGWSSTHPLTGGSVALTNTQANSAWTAAAVLWRFNTVTNATVAVERTSQGNTYTLGSVSVTNALSAVWVPAAEYSFALGDVLRVRSSVTNGQVQVIRRGE